MSAPDNRLVSPVRDRAYALIQRALGARPDLDRRIDDHLVLPMVDALLDLEETFRVDLDVDEVFGAGRTVRDLLDLVEARARDRRPPATAQLFSLAAFRRLGPTAETPSTLRDMT